MKAYGQPARLNKSLLKALTLEKVKGDFDSISDVIGFHRAKSRRLDRFNRELSRFFDQHPGMTLREFRAHWDSIVKF